MISHEFILLGLTLLLVGQALQGFWHKANAVDLALGFVVAASGFVICGLWVWDRYSRPGKERRKRLETILDLPPLLVQPSEHSVKLGLESDLRVPVYLPDSIRARHVHILGATGSGKTESVILNFLKQDVRRGIGAIILDAKGDASFERELRAWVPIERLRVFDLGDENSAPYDPLSAGTAIEGAQRLFASLTWSEEYYKSKAFSAIQRIFQSHRARYERNPTLKDISGYLEDPETFAAFTVSDEYPPKLAEKDFADLSGLRDQVRTLCIGHLEKILSADSGSGISLESVACGQVLYFRLQSLMSAQLVGTVGRLVINHLNFIAGTAHRHGELTTTLMPVYLDEFASFACPEFADLISKARSANLALHFSHQSVGDLTEVSPGFMSRITDNSAVKIILRINDPDSAEFFARSFGTRLYQKITQRITNVKEVDTAEVVGEGTQREAHRFRAAPDLFKTLPTGMGSILIAHGLETPHGASSVLKIQFPKLKEV